MECRSSVRSQSGAALPIMSFSLDPTWSCMMWPLWPAGEDSWASVSPGIISGAALPDSFAAAGGAVGSFVSPQGDRTLLQVCEIIPSIWAVIIKRVKTTSWSVLCIGIVSIVAYPIMRKLWTCFRCQKKDEDKAVSAVSSDVEHFDEDENVTGEYFGPVGPVMDSSTASLPLAGPVADPKSKDKEGKIHDDAYDASRRSGRYTPASNDGDADISEGSRSPDVHRGDKPRGKLPFKSSRGLLRRYFRRPYQPNPSSGTSSSSSLSPPYPPSSNRKQRHCVEKVPSSSSSVASGPRPANCDVIRNASGDNPFSLTRQRLPRDISVDSLGFSRGGSFDSSRSEVSTDSEMVAEVNAAAALSAAAVANADMFCDKTFKELQKDIEDLKNNVELLDEDLGQIKSNRNVPGMSSLLEVPEMLSSLGGHSQQHSSESVNDSSAKDCFNTLYSFTTIQNSPSFDLIDFEHPSSRESSTPVSPPDSLNYTRPLKTRKQPESMTSMEWDENDINPYLDSAYDEQPEQMPSTSLASAGSRQSPLDSKMADLGAYSRSFQSSDSAVSSAATYEQDPKSEPFVDHAMCDDFQDAVDIEVAEEALPVVAPEAEFTANVNKFIPEQDFGMNGRATSWNMWYERMGNWPWSSSTSGVSVSSMGSSVDSSTAAYSYNRSFTAPEPPKQCIVGPKLDINHYAKQEWRSSTPKCATMLKGYSQIPKQLGLRHLRVIRGDNYCAVRATFFGLLSNGGSVAVAAVDVAEQLSKLLSDPSYSWLKTWRFSRTVLSVVENGNEIDVETEMRKCLLAIDNTVVRLRSAKNPESTLARMLNKDPQLDARLCEGVKLLMIHAAINLHSTLSFAPETVPVFAQLLFARDTSMTPRDFMNNHLRAVGDTGGLEQVEMFLLGWALGISIRVVRVSSVDTEGFICWYPEKDCFSEPEVLDNRKTVDLVAEDDRHYNILVR